MPRPRGSRELYKRFAMPRRYIQPARDMPAPSVGAEWLGTRRLGVQLRVVQGLLGQIPLRLRSLSLGVCVSTGKELKGSRGFSLYHGLLYEGLDFCMLLLITLLLLALPVLLPFCASAASWRAHTAPLREITNFNQRQKEMEA